jgi:SAM-dependent methyltransferase
LPHPDGRFDVVWALSVFTHLTESWSSWLLELHRVLADDGLLITTFIGPGASRDLVDEAWDESRIGMNVLYSGRDWDDGGPVVLHSPWWIRAHWGRAFDVVTLRDDGFARTGTGAGGQGVVVLRKKEAFLTPGELERWEPGERRELQALHHNVRQAHRELDRLRSSTSWRATAPLRHLSSSWPLSAQPWRRLRSRGPS